MQYFSHFYFHVLVDEIISNALLSWPAAAAPDTWPRQLPSSHEATITTNCALVAISKENIPSVITICSERDR